MQEQVSSKVQDSKAIAAHESVNTSINSESASESKGKRTERKTQAQIVVEFLSPLGAYEADAIRIALALGKETVTTQSLSQEDKRQGWLDGGGSSGLSPVVRLGHFTGLKG